MRSFRPGDWYTGWPVLLSVCMSSRSLTCCPRFAVKITLVARLSRSLFKLSEEIGSGITSPFRLCDRTVPPARADIRGHGLRALIALGIAQKAVSIAKRYIVRRTAPLDVLLPGADCFATWLLHARSSLARNTASLAATWPAPRR